MKCPICKELTRVMDSEERRHQAALQTSYYLVTTELAARIQVDMERAKTALREHRSSCGAAQAGGAVSVMPSIPEALMVTGNTSFCTSEGQA